MSMSDIDRVTACALELTAGDERDAAGLLQGAAICQFLECCGVQPTKETADILVDQVVNVLALQAFRLKKGLPLPTLRWANGEAAVARGEDDA